MTGSHMLKAITLAKALMPRLSSEAAISEAARRYSIPRSDLAREMGRHAAARRKAQPRPASA